MNIRIAIRTDGSKSLGNGHIVRMLALAVELKERKIDFFFIIKHDQFWIKTIGENNQVMAIDNASDLVRILVDNKATHLIYDTRNDISAKDLSKIVDYSHTRLIVIDTPEDTRLVADVVIYPPVVQVRKWNWEGFKGEMNIGWEFVLLRKEFIGNEVVNGTKSKNKILLAFGSTDPAGYTENILQQIASSGEWTHAYEFVVLCGPQFDRVQQIENSVAFKKLNVTICKSPPDVSKVYKEVDFAIIAFGVTAYELAALGIPFLFIALTDDHAESAIIFEKNGYGISLGIGEPSKERFNEAIETMIKAKRHTLKESLMTKSEVPVICDWNKIINAIIE